MLDFKRQEPTIANIRLEVQIQKTSSRYFGDEDAKYRTKRLNERPKNDKRFVLEWVALVGSKGMGQSMSIFKVQ